jgi:hypothetical protein
VRVLNKIIFGLMSECFLSCSKQYENWRVQDCVVIKGDMYSQENIKIYIGD